MKHPYADILIAIAEGKEIQYSHLGNTWKCASAEDILQRILNQRNGAPENSFRIKPATITINGVVCEVPVPRFRDGCSLSVNGMFTETFWFTTPEARDAAFAALIKPFGEVV